jgi:very-short-patch-repair endonuclease
MGWRLRNGAWLIAEADGRSVHELPEALLHDRRRQNAFLVEAGASVVRFTWEDCRTPEYIPRVLRPMLRDGGWVPSRT